MKKIIACAGVIAMMSLTSCQEKNTEDMQTHGIQLDCMDLSVSPKENFFKFVNGKWLENNTIPEDRGTWGSFDELRKKNDIATLKVLKDAMASGKYTEGSDEYKAMTFFNTAMDTNSIDKVGASLLAPYLEEIDKIRSIQDLQRVMADILPYDIKAFFGYSVSAGLTNSEVNEAYLESSNLGLPDRSYYLDKDSDTQAKREAYVKHITRMFQLLGIQDAERTAESIMKLETRLASAMLSKEEARDMNKLNNPMTIKELEKLTPSINWKAYFNDIHSGDFKSIIVTQPKYMKELQKVLNSTPIESLKALLKWNFINAYASSLDSRLEKADFDFYTKTLNGVSKMRNREERVLSLTNDLLGDAVGKLYVAEVFPEEAKIKAKEMVDNIMKAFSKRIKNLSWMSEKTKEMAQKKLDKMMVQIGYPDTWKDYSKLEIRSFANGGSLFQNLLNISKWNFEENIAKLGKEVDRTEWEMAPQTVNAYFHPSYNKIVFPAAILQVPFYDYKADDAVNYGGIGAVIGHEISHCFDDAGARFDENGNLKDWWSKDDKQKFSSLGDKLVAQFDAVQVFDDVHLNGRYTLGENIGDLGGVNAAFEGLQMYLNEKGRPDNIDGFSPEQRFFISWTTVWRTMMRDDAMRNKIKTDPHSPGMYRATMPIQNMDEFHKAFNIKEGDKMYLSPEKRVKIW